jgi:hypothetical protein
MTKEDLYRLPDEVRTSNYPRIRLISFAYCNVGEGWDISDVSLMLSICDIACHHGSSLPLWISEMSITNAIMVKS